MVGPTPRVQGGVGPWARVLAGVLAACAAGEGATGGGAVSRPRAGAGSEPEGPRPEEQVPPVAPFRGPGPRFGARRLRGLALRPEHLLAGDLDGDGRTDLAATAEGGGTLLVWRGDSRGLSAEPTELQGPGWPLRPVLVPPGLELPPPLDDALADRPLLALASRGDRALALVDLGGGDEALRDARVVWNATGAPGTAGTPRALAGGELAAGTPGLALALDGGQLVVLGGGRQEVIELEGQLPRCALVLAGGAGIAVGAQDTRALEVVERTTGGLALRTRIELGFIPRELVELDLDGDGELELAVIGGAHTLRIFGLHRGGGADAWLVAHEAFHDLPTSAVPLSAVAADLDGDGADELVVTSAYGLAYEVFAPASTPALPARRLAGYAGQTPSGLAVADLDGDGALDLAVACKGARALALCFGAGDGGLEVAQQVPVGVGPNGLAELAAGPRGTGLAVLEAKDQTVGLLRGGAREPLAATAGSPRAPVAVDWDGDGARELAWLEGEGLASVRLHPARDTFDGRAAGGLRDALDLAALPLGQASGRRREALVVAEHGAGALVLLAEGRAPARLALEGDAPTAVAVWQAGADTRIAVALGAPGRRRGVALFAPRPELDAPGALALEELGFAPTAHAPIDLVALDPTPEDGPRAVAVLSKPDPRTPSGALELFVADAASPAGLRATALLPADGNPKRLAAGDVDGDGTAELFAAAQNAHRILAWQRAGSELVPLDALGAHLGPLDVTLADLDGDGVAELFVANGFSDDVSVIRGSPR